MFYGKTSLKQPLKQNGNMDHGVAVSDYPDILQRISKEYLSSRGIASLSKRDISLQLLTTIEKLVEMNYQLETILSEYSVEIAKQDHSTSCKHNMSSRCLEGAVPSKTLCLNAATATGTVPFMKCCSYHQPLPDGPSGASLKDNEVAVAENGAACRSDATQLHCEVQRTQESEKNYCATFTRKVVNSRVSKKDGEN